MGIPKLTHERVLDLENRSTLNNRVARLVTVVADVLVPRMQLAIGGAVAGVDAGWRRNTTDLDIFARPVSAKRLVRSLAAQGMHVYAVSDAHTVCWLDDDNTPELSAGVAPTVRIDVLHTVTQPEASAIRTAIPARVLGAGLKVFRPDYLAAIKFLAARPQDLVDFDELIRLGVDPQRVRYLVATADPARSAACAARIRRVLRPTGVADTHAVYVSRDGLEAAFSERAKRIARTTSRSPAAKRPRTASRRISLR